MNSLIARSPCLVFVVSFAPSLLTSLALAEHGRELGDMMHKNWVWGDLLIEKGYSRYTLPNTCPRCYTVADFAKDHPVGTYILGTGEHVVAVVDGDWYDTWDSGDEVPIIYYWRNNNGI